MNNTSPAPTTNLRLKSPPEHVFPKLTPAQMNRVAAHGRRRREEDGEVLLEMGESGKIFVVTARSIETVRMVGDVEEIIVTYGSPARSRSYRAAAASPATAHARRGK